MKVNKNTPVSTYMPFVFPKGIKHIPDDEGTRDEKTIKSNVYAYEDEVNGLKRWFRAREVRYKQMDDEGLESNLRVVYINYFNCFEMVSHEFLTTIELFDMMLEDKL